MWGWVLLLVEGLVVGVGCSMVWFMGMGWFWDSFRGFKVGF